MTSPTIQGILWRSNASGHYLEDLSAGLIQATATMDPENDQTWSLDATMDYDAWMTLTPYIDWIAPELVVTWPNGLVRRGQLGHYILIDPPTSRGEITATVQLQAMDPLWLLARQGFKDPLTVDPGENKSQAIRQILRQMTVSDDPNEHIRAAIPDTALTFRKSTEWDNTTNMLEIVNEILQGAGMWPLWSSKQGVLTTRQMGATMIQMQHPVRTYSANVPDGYHLNPTTTPLAGLPSEIVDVIETTPGFDDLLNQILMTNDDPTAGRIHSSKVVTNPNNRRAAFHNQQRRQSKKHHNKTLDDQGTADQVANGILDKLGTYNETIRITALPDPVPEFEREVIDCLIWDALGREVARSKYLVHRVAYGFTPSDGIMTIDAGRVDMAEGSLIPDQGA